jgi:transposase-like protein
MTMKRNRRKFSSKFKTKVVLASLTKRETIQQLATRFEIHPNQISQWKRQYLDGADTVFDGSSKTSTQIENIKPKNVYLQCPDLGKFTMFVKNMKIKNAF